MRLVASEEDGIDAVWAFDKDIQAVILRNSEDIQCYVAVKSRGGLQVGSSNKTNTKGQTMSIFSYNMKLHQLVLFRIKAAEESTTMDAECDRLFRGLKRFGINSVWEKPHKDRTGAPLLDENWDKTRGCTLNEQAVLWPLPNQRSTLPMLSNLAKFDGKITHEFVFVRRPGTAPNGLAEKKGDIYYMGDTFYTRTWCKVNLWNLGWAFINADVDEPYWKMPVSTVEKIYNKLTSQVLDAVEQDIISHRENANCR